MNGIEYRLQEFIGRESGRHVVLDASAGLALGPLPGLEDYVGNVRPILPLVDGLVSSPGQFRRLTGRTRQEAGLLVRCDWTNTLRGEEFVLPPEQTSHLTILSAQDALDMGAVGMVSSFLLGYEEQVEADCLYQMVQLALEGKAVGLPLVVEVCTDGPRVSLPGKAIELGASYALEGGADVIVVPNPGRASLETIAEFVSVPWFIKVKDWTQASQELVEALSMGAAGLWLDHTLFSLPDPIVFVERLVDATSAQPLAG
jgi:DhnA family fructose-bisphosphate aldolase class Ia